MVTQSLGKKRKKTDYTFSSRLDRGIFRSPLTPILSGFEALESAVAETFGLTCFGFFASLLPRLLFPLDI